MENTLQDELNTYSNKKSNKKAIYLVLILLIFVAGVYYYIQNTKQTNLDEIVYSTKKVTKGDVLVSVTATGNLEPTNSVDIGIEVSGTLKEIYVDFNDKVKIGQVLAKLDTTKLQSKVDSSKASLTIAKANLKESQVTVKRKKVEYDRVLKMYKKSGGKYPSVNEVDDAKFSYESALASNEATKAKVSQAQFNLKTDEENLQKAVVKSSINGVVLDRVVEIGQTVAATNSTPTLFTLAKDLSKMDLVVSIDEADVANIKEGLDVEFTVDAYPKEIFKGKIRQVRYNPVEVSGVITYETVVSVENEKLLLRPGMTATAKIFTKKIKDKLLVPNAALRFKPKFNKSKQNTSMKDIMGPPKRPMRKPSTKQIDRKPSDIKTVFILKDGKIKRTRLRVLDTNGKVTAVLSKELNENDEVIISQRSSNE